MIYDYLLCLSVSLERWETLQPIVANSLPARSSILTVQAYSDAGTTSTWDDDGNTIDPGTLPTVAPGLWFIATSPEDALPSELLQFVKSKAERGAGLVLPTGIVGLSTAWAGMQIQPGNPA